MRKSFQAKRLLRELIRRKVLTVAAGYLVVVFAVWEAADVSFPVLGIPGIWMRGVVVGALAAFPVVLVLAWRYDLTRQGLMRTLDPTSVEDPGPRASASAPPASIAVLPFVDMSPAADQEYFGDGLSEELLNVLARGTDLKVAARTSSFMFRGAATDVREIGRQMGVAHVLEGSVRKSGEQLRVTAQLIDAQKGFHVWSQAYDRMLEDLFEIQSDIAKAIASALVPHVARSKLGNALPSATLDLEAYDLYLKGKHLWYNRFRVGLMNAMEYFEAARQRDPSFALPYTGIAMTLTTLGYMALAPHEKAAVGLASAEKALELDPSLPEAHFAVGVSRFWVSWAWDEADAHLVRATELKPGYGEALIFRALLAAVKGDSAYMIPHDQGRSRHQCPRGCGSIPSGGFVPAPWQRRARGVVSACRVGAAGP